MCAVPSALGLAGGRVWQITSWGRGPRTRRPPLEGVHVTFPRRLGTIVEVSLAGYPDVVRGQPTIPPELTIICGLAVGYPDPDFPTNKLHIGRKLVDKNVVFHDN